MWVLSEALELIRSIEFKCPEAGCHVALTGGVLYKTGERKDLDILFYRIRQKEIDIEKLKEILLSCDVLIHKHYGWMYKASYQDRNIDIFIPELSNDKEDYKTECLNSIDRLSSI